MSIPSDLNLHHDAKLQFERSSLVTQGDALDTLRVLSYGFQITWFREVEQHLWAATIRPTKEITEHFGLRQECLVIGNGYTTNFHQNTLTYTPPIEIIDRVDPLIRFVASDAKMAEVFCSAWAQKNKSSIVMIQDITNKPISKESLYKILSKSIWRLDLFAESEPVKTPGEFFGREVFVGEILTKIIYGSPLAIFGLRKVGKSSVLGRIEDVLNEDASILTVSAFIIANNSRFISGRWWHLAAEILTIWRVKLEELAHANNSKLTVKAKKLIELIESKTDDIFSLTSAFEKDIQAILKSMRNLQKEIGCNSIKLLLLIDECDHLYPNREKSYHWKTDYFIFWNSLQSIKRSLDNPEDLVYVLCGVNPSGVELGSILGQPNPLYETQKVYLKPMDDDDAKALMNGLGIRMGLAFDEPALSRIYEFVGGHPLLLRKLGTAIHILNSNRSEMLQINQKEVQRCFDRKKRDFYNQALWMLEHLAETSPDEERLLRDLATGGIETYAELWEDNEFRETYTYHLEEYGLIEYQNDLPIIKLRLIQDSLKKPAASDFMEQKRNLKDTIDGLEQSIRIRLRADLERNRSPSEAVKLVISAIPSDTKNRPLGKQELYDIGELVGLMGILEGLNWGDYECLFAKYYEEIEWSGPAMEKEDRLKTINRVFTEAHLVRHNSDISIKERITGLGFIPYINSFTQLREMLTR